MRKFHLSATSKNNALTVEIRLDNENAWAAHFHGPGLGSLDWSGGELHCIGQIFTWIMAMYEYGGFS